MLLNALDKIEARFSWLYYVLYMGYHPDRAAFRTDELFFSIYNILEDCYKHLGNEAIRLMKCLEPIMVGSSLLLFDHVTNDHGSRPAVIAGLQEKNAALGPYVDL